MSPTAGHEEHILHTPIFEGSEKRVEIDFRLGASSPANGLRSLSRETLDELMTLAHCCIVSSRNNVELDAYVLSESSLFVYPTKWILKTCGTTRLLDSVPRLLEVAASLGLEPRRCKYTRASFLFPEKQPFPYTSFDNEVEFLETHFGKIGGSSHGGNAYVLGEPCQGLQWHVYLADDMQPLHAEFRPTYNMEVVMTELGAAAAQQFFRDEKFISAERTTHDSGIVDLKPGADIDDYVFEPCGYSMNGILGHGLITIHITPEAHQSYASVEISGYEEDMVDAVQLLTKVGKVFAPGKMAITLTIDKTQNCRNPGWGMLPSLPAGYGVQGASSQLSPCGGKVCYYTLAEKPQAPGSPITPLHHAASFLSVATTATSDSEVENGSEVEAVAAV